MLPQTGLCKRLGIRYPIVLAPMANSCNAPLVAAVSNAGGIGFYGHGLGPPQQLKKTIQDIATLTPGPFGVNLFVPPSSVVELTPAEAESLSSVRSYYTARRQQLGMPEPTQAPSIAALNDTFDKCVDVIVDAKVPVVSFTFGVPNNDVIQKCKKAGSVVIGTATNIREAQLLRDSGVDAIVAQELEVLVPTTCFVSGIKTAEGAQSA